MQAIRRSMLLPALLVVAFGGAVACGVSDPLLNVGLPDASQATDGGDDTDAGFDPDAGTDGGDTDGGTDAGLPPPYGEFAIELSSPSPVHDTQATFTVSSCGDAKEVLINQGAIPEETDEAWQACVTDENAITYAFEVGGLHELRVWVKNEEGQIFDVPERLSVVRGSMFAVGDSHTCALIAGAVKCWGDNKYGQLGLGADVPYSPTATTVPGLESGVQELSGGLHGEHTCALKEGRVLCWGRNTSGQIGNPDATDQCNKDAPTDCALSPMPVRSENNVELSDIVSISASMLHSCAIDSSGTAWCWGDNSFGQFMSGEANGPETMAVKASAVSGAVSQFVSMGALLTCVSTEKGIECAGLDYTNTVPSQFGSESALLGRGTSVACKFNYLCSATPTLPRVLVDAPAPVEQLSAGYYHACAIVEGNVRCWGANHLGQYGNGTAVPAANGGAVTLGQPADLLAAGAHHTCARLEGGKLACWGINDYGQLGALTAATCWDINAPCSRTPVEVSGLDGVLAVAAGRKQTCAAAHGTVWCWGGNSAGELGAPATDVCVDTQAQPQVCSLSPLEVAGIRAE